MDSYLILKTVHILSSTVLFGTGLGIAFFMFRAHSTSSLHEKYYSAKNTVLADSLFTLPAAIIQPVSGYWLISNSGYDATSLWLVLTYILYVIAGMCWLPVVWLQFQIRNILLTCIQQDIELPDKYFRYFRIWFLLGWPAFISLIVIFLLMVFKPV